MPKALAIDIGASSGRHIVGEIIDGKLVTKEIYRFENNVTSKDGRLLWDIDNLKKQIIKGLAVAKEVGEQPDTVAIDTWGVDYVLLDADQKEILPIYAYRDIRGEQSAPKVEKIIPFTELYAHSGIQRATFNTIYQLYDDKESGRLDKAAHFLMMPQYLSFVLCGKIENEYTDCSTTGMLNAQSKDWDPEIINILGYPKRLFKNPLPPATLLGNFTNEVKEKVGYDAGVVLCASHDTASAVAAAPLKKGDAYISSGTWSLMGIESLCPITTEQALAANLTNEGGIEYRFRLLKNIMGLWMIQSIRRETGKKYSFSELSQMAQQSTFEGKIDVNNQAFFAPESMIGAIREYLGKPDLPLGCVLRCVYHSLAQSYADTVKELEMVTGQSIQRIRIIGGGCQDNYLNRLTAEYTGKPVTAGPVEATAIGNLMSQFMALDKKMTPEKSRAIILDTFDIKEI